MKRLALVVALLLAGTTARATLVVLPIDGAVPDAQRAAQSRAQFRQAVLQRLRIGQDAPGEDG